MNKLEKITPYVLKDDMEYLRSKSPNRGDLSMHIRRAISLYVQSDKKYNSNYEKLFKEEK